jgi:hypothetical protein
MVGPDVHASGPIGAKAGPHCSPAFESTRLGEHVVKPATSEIGDCCKRNNIMLAAAMCYDERVVVTL